MKEKFTIIDYLIIILIIAAVVFAFIHITSDDSSKIQKTAFDASTINKMPDTFFNYYKDGYIVKSTINGYNATNGDEISLNGTVKWVQGTGSDVQMLIESDNRTYLAGLYNHIPNADIFIDKISLENDGDRYDNLVEVTAKPKNITSLTELKGNLSGDYEISTIISCDSIDSVKLQEIANKINQNGKRMSIATTEFDNQIILEKSDENNINDASAILGNMNGTTSDITIRIYNCSDSQLDQIKDNCEVINIRNF